MIGASEHGDSHYLYNLNKHPTPNSGSEAKVTPNLVPICSNRLYNKPVRGAHNMTSSLLRLPVEPKFKKEQSSLIWLVTSISNVLNFPKTKT